MTGLGNGYDLLIKGLRLFLHVEGKNLSTGTVVMMNGNQHAHTSFERSLTPRKIHATILINIARLFCLFWLTMKSSTFLCRISLFFPLLLTEEITGFGIVSYLQTKRALASNILRTSESHAHRCRQQQRMAVHDSDSNNDKDTPIIIITSSDEPNNGTQKKAATGTVNERLLAELKEAENIEKYGTRSKLGKKMGLGAFRSTKTEEERKASIEEARNLNGVNPATTIIAGFVALGMAAIVWAMTDAIAEYFALHPIDDETTVYFVARIQAVVRNIVMGGFALASGFCGVTGIGILLLGIRVAYGVAKGELDPTPLPSTQSSSLSSEEQQSVLELSNVWDLMLNKSQKRGRR
jgi:hypothetical protein